MLAAISRLGLPALLALAVCSLVLPAQAAEMPSRPEGGRPFVQTFGRRDYRGHPQVWCGTVDARGLLYFGNFGQVLVYDGVQWERVAIPGAGFIRALVLDGSGRLWVGGANALGYIDTNGAQPQFVSLSDRLPAAADGPGEIDRVHVVGQRVYLRSASWLFCWEQGKMTGWPLRAGGLWQSMVIEGELRLQNPLHGWWRAAEAGLEAMVPALPQLAPTRFALPMTDRRWLIGTMRTGLFTFDGRTLARPLPPVDNHLRANFLYNGCTLPGGRLVLTTLTGGAVVLEPDLSFHTLINEAAGLPGPAVNDAFADGRGGLWLCLGEGIARVSAALAYSWFPPPPPLGRIDDNAFARFSGRIHLGVGRDLLRLDSPPEGVGEPGWNLAQKFAGRVTALLPAGDTLLVGTADGCHAWREGEPAVNVAALNACAVLVASTLQPGRVYAGHGDGIAVLRQVGDRWVSEISVATDGAVLSLAEDADGAVWASTVQGLVRIVLPPSREPPLVETPRRIPGLPAGAETRLVRAGGRTLFVTERGLYRFGPGAAGFIVEPRFGARFADGSYGPGALAENAKGDLWIAPRRAGDTQSWSQLGRAAPSGEWFPLDTPDATRIGDVIGLHLEREAEREILWVVGVAGVLRVDLGALRPTSPGATLVRAVTSTDERGQRQAESPAAALNYERNSLRFRVAAPGLAGLSGVQFETELTGFGRGARQLSPSAERDFTNLREGRYVFRARATDAAGRWTAPAEFAFQVLPPWWRTPWAYAAGALLLAGGIAGLVTVRTRALRSRAAELELTVAERTLELQVRNQELTRLHRLELDEKISARLAEEKAQLETLRYQLNPHFLFNTLNSLYGLVEDHPAAADMVLGLSEFCRLTLTRGSDHLQTVADEFQMLAAYLRIEQVRWGDSLRIELTADPAVRAMRLPSFLLLPLVENAIKYGGETSPDLLEVRVTARQAGESGLVIEVANTGRWLAPGTHAVHSTGVGVENLRQRLARHYPGAHEFSTEAAAGWVTVRLRLGLAPTDAPTDLRGGQSAPPNASAPPVDSRTGSRITSDNPSARP